MTSHVMHREVCLKHRKNRREILLRVRTQVPSWQRCLFFFVVCGAGVTTRAAFCGHRPRAGFLNANQGMPVQFRLIAPFFRYPHIETHNVCGGRQIAQLGLQNLAGSGQHRDAVPLFKSRGARWEGSGLISVNERVRFPPPPPISWAARPFRRSLASQEGMRRAEAQSCKARSAHCIAAGAAKHGAKPWRSTISNRLAPPVNRRWRVVQRGVARRPFDTPSRYCRSSRALYCSKVSDPLRGDIGNVRGGRL